MSELPHRDGDPPVAAPASEEQHDDVEVLNLDGRRVVLVGTAHVSRESVDQVRAVIERERPDAVCVELDEGRFQALQDEHRFESLDLRQVIRNQQLATLLASLVLSSYQRRLGVKLGVTPGAELLEAIRVAEELGIPVHLCDREIRATLRRAWHAVPWWKKFMLLSSLVASLFERPELSESELREMRRRDVVNELMQELGEALPELKRTLIDERDAYLSERIRTCPGERLVAVVGAGHVSGMVAALQAGERADLEALSRVPPPSPAWRWMGWGVPALIVGALVAVAFLKGPETAGAGALYWFFANAVPCAIGGALALGHPATVAAGFFSAPFTSLTPVIGAGYVCAFVQAVMHPPMVREFRRAGEDAATFVGWWRSRLLRIFVVFLFTTLGSFAGTWVGGVRIFLDLF